MARLYHARGILLSFRELTERDRLAIFFTREYGKQTFLAKGVKREGAKLRYRLNPYSVLDVECVSGRSFDRITAVRDVASLRNLLGDAAFSLQAYSLALLLIDILETVVQESDPEPELFEESLTFLNLLKEADIQEYDALFVFLVFRILFLSGVGVDLTRCVRSGQTHSPRFVLHIREGGLISVRYASPTEGDILMGERDIALLRAFQSGHFYQGIKHIEEYETNLGSLITVSMRYLEYQGIRLRSLHFWYQMRYNT